MGRVGNEIVNDRVLPEIVWQGGWISLPKLQFFKVEQARDRSNHKFSAHNLTKNMSKSAQVNIQVDTIPASRMFSGNC